MLAAKLLACYTAMQEVSHWNPTSYLCWNCWNMHVGNGNWLPCFLLRGWQVLHQRWISGNIHHVYLCQAEKRLPTLALKPRGDITRSSKQGWPHKRRCVHQILFKTRMHSSRMHTGRSLTVCCSLLPGGGGSPCGGRGFLPVGGLPGLGGVCLVQGGSPWSGGVLPGPRGVPPAGWGLLGPGGSAWSGGFSLVRGGSPWSGEGGDPPCGQNHRHV